MNRASTAHLAPPAPPLRWSSDAEPGIRRLRRGKVFIYRDAKGRAVRDTDELRRIRSLAIPPAYEDVWICPRPDGHLQATGRDARGRKQYRYHPEWQAHRGETKFGHLREFGLALPRIRRRVQKMMSGDTEPTRDRVLATLVRLLDTTWLRIGNDEYVRANQSFGLSTLRNRHAGLQGDQLHLSFKGKSGVKHDVVLTDRRVARIVRRCRDLPGQDLFEYIAEDGEIRRITSTDVNEWLTDAAGGRVTAKDFRTWHGSVQALDLTLAACAADAEPCTPKSVLERVARRLGNTPAVCRKSYIHPTVLELGESLSDEALRKKLREARWASGGKEVRGLTLAERRLMALLRSS